MFYHTHITGGFLDVANAIVWIGGVLLFSSIYLLIYIGFDPLLNALFAFIV